MKEPIPLTPGDIDPGVEIVREFESEELGERSRAQYFYHSKGNELPVRDVTSTQGEGRKPEPCIERKAENYCTDCLPGNIENFAEDHSERYLLLFTRCRNSNLQEDGSQYYVGYIDKRRELDIQGRTAVQGPIKLVSFENACPLEGVGSPDTRNQKRLNPNQTRTILGHLEGAKNIYHDCVDEVERLQRQGGKPRYWEEEYVPPEGEDPLDDTGGC